MKLGRHDLLATVCLLWMGWLARLKLDVWASEFDLFAVRAEICSDVSCCLPYRYGAGVERRWRLSDEIASLLCLRCASGACFKVCASPCPNFLLLGAGSCHLFPRASSSACGNRRSTKDMMASYPSDLPASTIPLSTMANSQR